MRRTLVLQTVKGWTYARCGLPGEVLKQSEWKEAALKEGEVRVKVTHFPVLATDIQMITGTYGGYKAEQYPAVAGTTGVGEVVEAGPGATLSVGSTVTVLKQNVGTWATELTTACGNLYEVGSLKLTPTQAALLPLYAAGVAMSSQFGPVAGRVCWVLGADLPLGAAVATALKAKKAKVVTVAHTSGCDYTADSLASAAADPPNFIFNGLGGKALRIATDSAAEEAVVVTYDNASREAMSVAGDRAVLNGLQMRSFWFKRWAETSSVDEKRAVFEEAATLAKGGAVKQNVFDFKDFATAFDTVYSGTTVPVVGVK